MVAAVSDSKLLYHVDARYRPDNYNSWMRITKNPITNNSAPIINNFNGVSFINKDLSDGEFFVEIGYTDTSGKRIKFVANENTEIGIEMNRGYYDSYLPLIATDRPFAIEAFDSIVNKFNMQRYAMRVEVSVLKN